MEDYQIVNLYWARNESAITESGNKYGRMLSSLAYSVTASDQDSEECVNDTYLAAWNHMPQDRPEYLGAYLSRIVRHFSIDRYRKQRSEKRGGADSVTAELDECIPGGEDPQKELENEQLRGTINRFLYSLDEEKRTIFVLRYYYAKPVADISAQLSVSESKIKTTLFRLCSMLRSILEKEDLL